MHVPAFIDPSPYRAILDTMTVIEAVARAKARKDELKHARFQGMLPVRCSNVPDVRREENEG